MTHAFIKWRFRSEHRFRAMLSISFLLLVSIAASGAVVTVAHPREANAQSSRIITSVTDGGTPGLGSRELTSTSLLKVCETVEVDGDSVRDAVLQGLREHYIAEVDSEKKNRPKFETQRFLLRTELIESHDKRNSQVPLGTKTYHSMEVQIEARWSETRHKIALEITTRLFTGTSSDTARHKPAKGAYDGHFFHDRFGKMVLRELAERNCLEA